MDLEKKKSSGSIYLLVGGILGVVTVLGYVLTNSRIFDLVAIGSIILLILGSQAKFKKG